jgi:hypothetical protein
VTRSGVDKTVVVVGESVVVVGGSVVVGGNVVEIGASVDVAVCVSEVETSGEIDVVEVEASSSEQAANTKTPAARIAIAMLLIADRPSNHLPFGADTPSPRRLRKCCVWG